VASAPRVNTRIDTELVDAARAALGYPDVSVHTLLRAGLMRLAGVPADVALRSARRRRGPRPKPGAAR
jgi:hypothetical protein